MYLHYKNLNRKVDISSWKNLKFKYLTENFNLNCTINIWSEENKFDLFANGVAFCIFQKYFWKVRNFLHFFRYWFNDFIFQADDADL